MFPIAHNCQATTEIAHHAQLIISGVLAPTNALLQQVAAPAQSVSHRTAQSTWLYSVIASTAHHHIIGVHHPTHANNQVPELAMVEVLYLLIRIALLAISILAHSAHNTIIGAKILKHACPHQHQQPAN